VWAFRADLKFFSLQNKAMNRVRRPAERSGRQGRGLQSYERKHESLPCRLGSRKRFVAVDFAWKEFSVLTFYFFCVKTKEEAISNMK